jgi:hypothetical protein
MKMTRDHYHRLELNIQDVMGLYPDAINKMRAKGWNNNMIRWEVYHHTDIMLKNDLYKYCNDDHIQTALTKIIPL